MYNRRSKPLGSSLSTGSAVLPWHVRPVQPVKVQSLVQPIHSGGEKTGQKQLHSFVVHTPSAPPPPPPPPPPAGSGSALDVRGSSRILFFGLRSDVSTKRSWLNAR